ncbi:hypothetical protein GCM10009716_28180 [Streptomyces sodiiphilus]|uniref:Secreted protein n=1 Tax=Streptomyces sodiiphilus TaxID=226217 RepID=A0ABP5AP64_9ACTN
MSTDAIIIFGVAVAIILGLIFFLPRMQGGGGNVERRFGPEYDRTVARHDGDTKAARKDLSDRLRRHRDLRTRRLSERERDQYAAQWAAIQEQFVDSPAAAVAEADHLLTRLVHDRGFPSDEYDEQISALSVHHPKRVDGYRRLHAVAGQEHPGGTDTEELRAVMIEARELFEDLLTSEPDRPRGKRLRLSERLHVPGMRNRHQPTTSGGGA